jgi:hypothetical protein
VGSFWVLLILEWVSGPRRGFTPRSSPRTPRWFYGEYGECLAWENYSPYLFLYSPYLSITPLSTYKTNMDTLGNAGRSLDAKLINTGFSLH